jgi:MFS family permease
MTARHRLGGLLRDPVYVRVWLIGCFGGVARWLEMLVLGVFAFETTGSPFLVALLVILRLMPLAVFGPLVGTFADRLAPRLFLRASLSLATAVSATVFGLFALDLAQFWHVAVAAFASGVVWTTDMPLRRRILGDVAGRERLAPAMSLDSATNNATRMLGPLIGGLLYQWLGTGGAFALSTALYGVCVVLTLGVPAAASFVARAGPSTKIRRDFQEAFRFVAGEPDVRRILMVTMVFNIWGFPFISMIPVIGGDELGVSAGLIGALAALEGGGAFLGALVIALMAPGTGFRRLYYFGTMGYLVLIFVAGWMTGAASMGPVLFCVGLFGAGFTTMQSTLIYSIAPAEMRGRLFGVLVLCIGTGLIGFFNIGLMGEWFGGTAAIRIVAAEGLVPLLFIGIGWRALWRGDGQRV